MNEPVIEKVKVSYRCHW